MSSLRTKVASIEIENPTILASGIMGETGASLLRMAKAGAGALVTKSIGLEPRKGYDNPTLVDCDWGYINAMGLPNPGINAFSEEMRIALEGGKPIIGSIFAASPSEFSELAVRMEEYGAAAVELNLSCPHASGYGMEVGIDPVAVRRILESVKGEVKIPVFAKLTPNTHYLVEVGKAVQEGGGDAVVAINTIKAMQICVETRKPVLSHRSGGLSGPALRAVGVRCVYELYSELEIPVIGVGGIEDWRSAVEYIMAGASAVQIGSAIGRVGLDVFKEITDGISSFMSREGFNNVIEMVGIAHE